MSEKDRIIQIIYQAVDEVNQLFPDDQQLEKKPNTPLYAQDGGLDSLSLVRLIIETEQKIEEEFNVHLSLASEKAFSMKNSPFSSIAVLAEFISVMMREGAND
ncbi:MAG: hypothetical protein VYA53_02440 [Acidobacteriota bacterium]|nr:hypothetical protein [Acidobacteriota bacterium]